MSTAPDRALRDRIRSEETFCVTLVDWQGALAARQVFGQFMKIFSDAGLSPSVWLASHGMDQRAISGRPEIEKTLKESAASCFELTLRHERDDFPGAWDISCLFYDANNEHEQTRGLSCLQVAVLASLVADRDAMSASLAQFVADRAAFCYGYAFTAAYGLDLETYGPGLATSGAICPELEDPYAWPKELLQARRHTQLRLEPTVTAAIFAPLSSLAFDDHELALIRPALRFELAIASAQGPEVLDFYRKSRAALGDRLQFLGTGSGTWKKITARTGPMVEAWCNQPAPYPKTCYFCAMQGADKGVTAASLDIDFVARPPHEPTPALPTEMLLG